MMSKTKEIILPTSLNERITSIDLLRGIAVLGILIMNIQHFSMIPSAYGNPTTFGDLSGINKWVWILSHAIASEKFMTIFSILFGAGILLFAERAFQKGRKVSAFHYRRMMWLFVFGMLHAYLLWHGDILVNYSLCGMFVFLFRKKSTKSLLILASVFFAIPLLLFAMSGLTIPMWPQESFNEVLKGWAPNAEKIASDIAAMQGGWIEQMGTRVKGAIAMQTGVFFFYSFWRVTAMMLLGMALFKWKILSAEKSTKFYTRMLFIGLPLGYALIAFGVYENFLHNWSMQYSMFFGNMCNYVGSIGVAFGYIALIMLISKSVKYSRFKSTFSAVGKMAFTNYILMSFLGMFIFYGNGFGLFGQVERKIQVLIVIAIWIFLILVSNIWLKKFRFGPLEWFWRVLTYWKIQPIKK